MQPLNWTAGWCVSDGTLENADMCDCATQIPLKINLFHWLHDKEALTYEKRAGSRFVERHGAVMKITYKIDSSPFSSEHRACSLSGRSACWGMRTHKVKENNWLTKDRLHTQFIFNKRLSSFKQTGGNSPLARDYFQQRINPHFVL